MIVAGLLLSTALGLCLLVMALADGRSIAVVVLVMTGVALSFGLISPNTIGEALQPLPAIAGAAGAAVMFLQMLGAAASSSMVAWLFDGRSALSMAVTMLLFCGLASVCHLAATLVAPRGVPGLSRKTNPIQSEESMMSSNRKLNPAFLVRDGVRLAHFEAGPADPRMPPLVLVIGWTDDHRIFSPQIEHFARRRRVVAVNLRGHGASDAPRQEYTMAGFADDIAWQCAELGLHRAVVVGHSLGGAISLELCGRYPELASGLIMIDSIVMGRGEMRDAPELHQLLAGIGGPGYLDVSRANAWEIGCDYDDPARRQAIFEDYILPACQSTPQHVAVSAIRNAVLNHDPAPAAAACRIPMAYISADVPLVNMARDLDRLRQLCPQLVIAKTMLAGHFNTIEVAEQVSAMIERFLAVGLGSYRT